MYRGRTIITFRISDDELEELKSIIAEVNDRRRSEPFTTSSFITTAIREKISHYKRSRKAHTTKTEGDN